MKIFNHQLLNRREFVQQTSSCAGLFLSMGGLPFANQAIDSPSFAPIKIKRVDSNFEREPLHPYRFKGSAITDSWQTIAFLEAETGTRKIGLATQGVLWSDARVA